uniref:Amino acid transporter transmembrane domain-containing protein n=2 Tax=Globisporangium ultimum (strain ATCC 200006 / CBS 805.95 / DAOM BR144) TaxID=431595 RepID=K3X2M8_GLOUD
MADERAHLLKSSAASSSNLSHAEAATHDATHGVKPYGPAITLAMTLNYVIGTGCFGLPYAFMEAGIVLTSTMLIVGVFGAIITMNYTLESLARAEGVCAATRGGAPLHHLTYRKFDFATIGDMFAGKFGKITVQIVIALYCIGALWSYASVFASSVASLFFSYVLGDSCDAYGISPSMGCLEAYYVSMAVFSVIVISMVLLNISDQASIQKFLSVYRIAALVLMLVTMLIKISVDGSGALGDRYNRIGAFNWSNFGKGFGPTLLALNCQYNMPDALQPLNPKSYARKVAFGALIISGSFYLLVGLLGALAFDNINPLASLMWSTYTGCGNGWDDCGSTNPFGVFVQLVILIFPVVNVTSAYPMVGVTVGDNMLMSIPKVVTDALGPSVTRSLCRLLAAVPPLVLAVVFKKLDFIFSVAGLFGFLLGLSIPCWFQVIGSRYCKRVWGFSGAAITPFTEPIISTVGFAGMFLTITFVITGVAISTLNG